MARRNIRVAVIAAVSIPALAAPAIAAHRWNNYHWNRPSGEITPRVGDNVTTAWDNYLRVAMNGDASGHRGWNYSSYIQSSVVAGASSRRTCKAVAGTIQVCNNTYGQNGWLGIATIWLSGGHIAQGTTKLNDTYFNTARYNTPAWRRMVMCQEVGHDYGLGHVNENFNNLNTGSCMDYTNDPSGKAGTNGTLSNEYPNQHDFDELRTIYTSHADSAAATNFAMRTPGQAVPRQGDDLGDGVPGDGPPAWGRAIHRDGQGRPDVFELDLGNGKKKITHVFWAIGEGPRGGHHDEHED
jgi:hypothetical protein